MAATALDPASAAIGAANRRGVNITLPTGERIVMIGTNSYACPLCDLVAPSTAAIASHLPCLQPRSSSSSQHHIPPPTIPPFDPSIDAPPCPTCLKELQVSVPVPQRDLASHEERWHRLSVRVRYRDGRGGVLRREFAGVFRCGRIAGGKRRARARDGCGAWFTTAAQVIDHARNCDGVSSSSSSPSSSYSSPSTSSERGGHHHDRRHGHRRTDSASSSSNVHHTTFIGHPLESSRSSSSSTANRGDVMSVKSLLNDSDVE